MKKENQILDNSNQETILSHSYNLSIRQRITLPFLWLYWVLHQSDNKKSWHLVKKGMERHTHNYTTNTFVKEGITFVKCDHEGCNVCDVIDDPLLKY